MKRIGGWASWVGVAMVTALLLLTVGQVGAAVPPVLVFRANLNGLANENYRGGNQALAPLSSRVIDDANRDVVTTPTPGATLPSSEPEPVVASPAPSAPSPNTTPPWVPTPSPTPVDPTVQAGSVTGAVQDSQSSLGISNALVSLNPIGLLTVTSSNGGFSFASVPAGPYTVTANASGYQRVSTGVTVTAGHNANINLHLVSTASIGSVQGVVKSSVTGKTVAGATVALTPGALAVITDSTGYYGLPNVTPGTYTLTVMAPGYQPYSQTITVASGHTARANVSLTPV